MNDQERIEGLMTGLRQNAGADMCTAIGVGLHGEDESIDVESTAAAIMNAGRMALYRPRWWAFFVELVREHDDLTDPDFRRKQIEMITDITAKYPAIEYDEMMHVLTEMIDEGSDTVLDSPETSCYPRTVEVLTPIFREVDAEADVLATLKSALEDTVNVLQKSMADQTPDKEEGDPEA